MMPHMGWALSDDELRDEMRRGLLDAYTELRDEMLGQDVISRNVVSDADRQP